jgi:hypothetical protein
MDKVTGAAALRKLVITESLENYGQTGALQLARERGFRLVRQPVGKRGSLIEIYRGEQRLGYRKSWHAAAKFMTKLEGFDIDELVRKYSAFESLGDMTHAAGGYSPSVRCLSAQPETERLELLAIAEAYDAAQEKRGDARRAYRS